MIYPVQTFAGIAVLLAAVAIMIIFRKVATAKHTVEDYKKVAEKGYAIRRKYFYALLIVSLIFSGRR